MNKEPIVAGLVTWVVVQITDDVVSMEVGNFVVSRAECVVRIVAVMILRTCAMRMGIASRRDGKVYLCLSI